MTARSRSRGIAFRYRSCPTCWGRVRLACSLATSRTTESPSRRPSANGNQFAPVPHWEARRPRLETSRLAMSSGRSSTKEQPFPTRSLWARAATQWKSIGRRRSITARPLSPRAPETYFVGTAPASVTVADINGDGIPDLLVANQGSNDVSVIFGSYDANGDWVGIPGPRLKSGGDGPIAVIVADLTGQFVPRSRGRQWRQRYRDPIAGCRRRLLR